jgi:hypothetical protein
MFGTYFASKALITKQLHCSKQLAAIIVTIGAGHPVAWKIVEGNVIKMNLYSVPSALEASIRWNMEVLEHTLTGTSKPSPKQMVFENIIG